MRICFAFASTACKNHDHTVGHPSIVPDENGPSKTVLPDCQSQLATVQLCYGSRSQLLDVAVALPLSASCQMVSTFVRSIFCFKKGNNEITEHFV